MQWLLLIFQNLVPWCGIQFMRTISLANLSIRLQKKLSCASCRLVAKLKPKLRTVGTTHKAHLQKCKRIVSTVPTVVYLSFSLVSGLNCPLKDWCARSMAISTGLRPMAKWHRLRNWTPAYKGRRIRQAIECHPAHKLHHLHCTLCTPNGSQLKATELTTN